MQMWQTPSGLRLITDGTNWAGVASGGITTNLTAPFIHHRVILGATIYRDGLRSGTVWNLAMSYTGDPQPHWTPNPNAAEALKTFLYAARAHVQDHPIEDAPLLAGAARDHLLGRRKLAAGICMSRIRMLRGKCTAELVRARSDAEAHIEALTTELSDHLDLDDVEIPGLLIELDDPIEMTPTGSNGWTEHHTSEGHTYRCRTADPYDAVHVSIGSMQVNRMTLGIAFDVSVHGRGDESEQLVTCGQVTRLAGATRHGRPTSFGGLSDNARRQVDALVKRIAAGHCQRPDIQDLITAAALETNTNALRLTQRAATAHIEELTGRLADLDEQERALHDAINGT